MKFFKLMIVVLLVVTTGCVGGSRGTGVRTLDKPMPDREDAVRNWSMFTPRTCTLETKSGELDLSLSTEFGISEAIKTKIGTCSFAISGQALKIVLSFKSDPPTMAPLKYMVIEHACTGQNLQSELSHGDISPTANTIALRSLPFKKGIYFELMLFTHDSNDPIQVRIDGFGSGCSPENENSANR